MHDPDLAPSPAARRERDGAKLVYVLYLVGFFAPVAALAGVILAHIRRGSGDEVADTHYTFQIRSFWIGLLASILGGLLTMVLIGYLILAVWIVWAAARFITGLIKLVDDAPVDDPQGWGFSA